MTTNQPDPYPLILRFILCPYSDQSVIAFCFFLPIQHEAM